MIDEKHLSSFSLQKKLTYLPRATKRLIMIASDVVVLPLLLFGAMALQSADVGQNFAQRWWLAPATVVVSVPLFIRFGLYRAVVRFMGVRVVYAVLKAVCLSFAALVVLDVLVGDWRRDLAALIIFWALTLLYVGGSRFCVRSFLQRQRAPRERVAIYGAGEGGVRLVSALLGGQEFVPVVFIDDSIALHGSVINGLEVFSPRELPRLIDELEISRVLLALPSAPRRRRRQILVRLEALSVHVQTMPDIGDLISGKSRVDEIREVDVADLLGRDAVPPDDELLDACIRGHSVMVTGAGGSIGSELCRQILLLGPSRLVLFERSELGLYTIDQELRLMAARDGLDIEIVALLGDVCDERRVREVMLTFGVQTVYHAAAYKHVPLVEQNVLEGVRNNVIGTWRTATAAIDAEVQTFVFVSTDKAVCPTNVMGATKRFSELILQSLNGRAHNTRVCMVRFGNVLASSGSVVPLFREQIRQGGPVTVTHPDVMRYFMTIPEAAQLVIQAGSMAEGGDVFVLEMGRPVRIEDLARRMIHMMGLQVQDDEHPDGDIAIKYTGLRPAEKLREELLISNNVMGTEHPMIMRALEDSLEWEQVRALLDRLQRAVDSLDCEGARGALLEGVAGYEPSSGPQDLVARRRVRAVRVPPAETTPAKVTEIRSKREPAGFPQ